MKTSEKSILRVKDLKEQPESRFVLLPAGLDRVIVACDYYDVTDGVLTVYGPDGQAGGPRFCCPVAAGFVIVERSLTDVETLMEVMKRMHGDEQEALQVHAELEEAAEKKPEITPSKVRGIRPEFEPPAAPVTDPRHPGQYL